jgi:hypothetical protein
VEKSGGLGRREKEREKKKEAIEAAPGRTTVLIV